MAQPDTPSSGRDPDYQAFINEQRKARRLLARMDRMEDFARQWEQFPQIYTHLVGRELESRRQLFANSYRRLVGVAPDKRWSLRRELQELMHTGHRTVDVVIAAVRDTAAALLTDRNPNDPFA